MADRCAGCMNKFKFREKPTVCAKCRRNFCSVCIPPAKHKKQKEPAVRDTCVYCTRQLQEAMKEQEAVVLENFPDRFYHSPHLQPTLHTKLCLNDDKLRQNSAGGGGGSGGGHPEPLLIEEDRKLEERLRKLKESHKPTTPAGSETVLQDRLAKLREEPKSKSSGEAGKGPPPSRSNQPQTSGGLSQPGNKTQAEQADDLVDQVSDVVKLDAKVDQGSQHHSFLEDSMNTFLTGLEIQVEDEDPDKLLEVFKKFQSREECLAFADATSSDVQALVEKAKELQQQEQDELGKDDQRANFITPYPQLPDVEGQGLGEDKISQFEISKVMEETQKEIDQEERERKHIDQFISEASEELSKLRGVEKREMDSDHEVRSKLEPRKELEPPPRLDFSWCHFGGSGGVGRSTDNGQEETAARQLGITLSNEVFISGEMDSSGEVASLIERTMAEAALDRKLEEKGLDHYLGTPGKSSSKSSEEGGATASGSSGACAATNYLSMASGWEADPEDLPWCCICNSDAHIRCCDCDNDLYCTQCFSEGHEQFGLFDHKYAPFEPPSSS